MFRSFFMFKYFALFLGICILSSSVYAADEGVVSLFDDDGSSSNEKETPEQKERKEGFLSFMNLDVPKKMFSFSKDETQEEKPTTLEDTVKMAERGDLQAQLALGYAYLYGEDGISKDYEKSFHYYSKAALQNDPTGLNNLGSLYYGGIGVKRDVKKAAVLFKKAAELGNINAAVNIGFMHASGKGAKKDIVLGLKYFELALSDDVPAAKFMIGYAHYKGLHRDLDYAKAAPLLKAAADAGFDEAQTIVADIYINGLGFPQNYNNGVKYLNKAIMQGDAKAMEHLADILIEGKKYNRDIEYAHVLYNLASVRGVTSAVAKRNAIEGMMKIEEVLRAQRKAETFKEELSSVTSYIRQTYGKNLISYFE